MKSKKKTNGPSVIPQLEDNIAERLQPHFGNILEEFLKIVNELEIVHSKDLDTVCEDLLTKIG